MSDVRVQMVTVAVPGTTGTFDVTIPGFGTPKAMLCISNNQDVDNVVGTFPQVCIGACDGVNQFAVSQATQEGNSTANSASSTGTGAIRRIISYNSLTTYGVWEFDQWITDGVRINCTLFGGAVGALLQLVFFAGDDIDVNCGYQSYTANDYTGFVSLGYDPAMVFFPSNFAGSTPEADASQLIGAWAPADGNFSTAYETRSDQSTTVGWAKVNSDRVAASYLADYITQISAEAGGFRINCTGNSSNSGTAYMAFDLRNGAQAKVFNTVVPATIGTYTEAAPGFEPVFGMVSLNSGPLALDGPFTTTSILSNAMALMTRGEGVASLGSTFRVGAAHSLSTRNTSTDSLWQISYASQNEIIKSSSGGITSTGWDFTLSRAPDADVYGMGWAISDEGDTPTGIQEMYVNIGGTFTKATPSVLVGGVWKPADAYVLISGVWKPIYEQ